MPFIADECRPEESDSHQKTFKPSWSSGDFYAKMEPKSNHSKISSEELRATQLRLYLLLIEAQDRLERERGLVRTFPGRRPSDVRSKTDGGVDDSSTPDGKST